MKKLFVIFCLLLSSVIVFANEKEIHFNMPQFKIERLFKEKSSKHLNNLERKKAGAIGMTVTGGVFLAGGLVIAGLTVWEGIITECFSGMFQGACTSLIGFCAHVFLLGGTLLLCSGIHRLSTLRKTDYGSQKWSEQMYILRRNIGIILLTTSVFPLTTTVLTMIATCQGSFLILLLPVTILELFPVLIAQIVIGVNMIVSWYKSLNVTPEISFTHDSKKGFDEGYSVRMGLRVRI